MKSLRKRLRKNLPTLKLLFATNKGKVTTQIIISNTSKSDLSLKLAKQSNIVVKLPKKNNLSVQEFEEKIL